MHSIVTREMSVGYVLFMFVFGLFLFWRSMRRNVVMCDADRRTEEIEEDARRWGFKVFDIMVLSLLGAVIVSRVSYIIAQPDLFRASRWFWIPYEKVDEAIRLFSSFPWLFFRVWDGPLPLESLILGWVLSLVAISRFLRVPWGFLADGISDVYYVCLFGLEVYIAAKWEVGGPLLVVGYLLVLGLLKWKSKPNKALIASSISHKTISIVWKISTIVGLPFALFVWDAFYRVFLGREFFMAISVLAIILGIWIMAKDLVEYMKILRYGGKFLSSSPIVNLEGTGRVASAQSGSGWRKYLHDKPIKNIEGLRTVPRDFSKTYRDYTTVWERLWGKTLGRIYSRRRITDEEEAPTKPIS